ncbi:MAG: uracil-DNA glycosylase family protein [Pseudomonadota bacterium]|nr:uracil-DNA glycosylase family protein [Pseudomonadota bacterium]
MQKLSTCKKCTRIVNNLIKLKKSNPEYLNRPIIPSPRDNAYLCIVGLAPGLTGANRTGRIFDGDYSGDILSRALLASNFNDKHKNNYPYITNAVKCYPPKNKPNITEINNCNTFLKNELDSLKKLKVIIALGFVAHNSVLSAYSLVKNNYKFSHGKIHIICKDLVLIDSYHCSKINVYTKRLTISMLAEILKKAKSYR